MITYIYTLSHPITGEVKYVGKTVNPKQRKHNHSNIARDKGTYKRNWINLLKSQKLRPKFEVIDEVTDDWKFWEKYWIAQFKVWGFTLCNYTLGGDGLESANQTSFKKGQIPWNKGTAKPIIKRGFNHKCLETSFKKGHSSWNKGKPGYTTTKKGTSVSTEVKQKISNTLKGRPSLKKRIIKQYNKEMILINTHSSVSEAKLITGIKGIGNALTGRVKTAGGYIWQ